MVNNSSNSTSFGDEMGVFRPAYDLCLIALAVLIIAINVLVVYLFIRKDYLRTKTNSFLVSLALSDLMTGFLAIPLYLLCSATQYRFRSQVCIFAAAFYRCIAVSTMAHILVVTLERYVAVMFPMRYYRIVTKCRVCFVIALVWMFSILYASIQFSWIDFADHRVNTMYRKDLEKIYHITGAILCFTVPLCLMLFCFGRMLIVIRKQVKNIRRQAEMSADPRNRSIASDKRALIIFATMLGIFTLCWLSWYITLFQVQLGKGAILPESLADLLDFLRFGTSFFNPMLYTFLKNDFHRAVCSLLPNCCSEYDKVTRKQDAGSVSRVTVSTAGTDANGNKPTALSNGLSPNHDRLDEFMYKDFRDLPDTENLQLITHV